MRNNIYCIFLSFYFKISQDGISRNSKIHFNAIIFLLLLEFAAKRNSFFLYHLLQRKYCSYFSLLLFFEFHEIKFLWNIKARNLFFRSFCKSPFTDFNLVTFLIRDIVKSYLHNHSNQETQISIFQEIKLFLLYLFIGFFLCLNAANL